MRVPNNPGPQETLNPLSGFRHSATYVPQAPPLGALVEPLAEAAEVKRKAEDEANNLRTEEGFNTLRTIESGLVTEFSTRLKANVLPQDGKSFTDTYMGKFEDAVANVEKGLANKKQKELFRRRAEQLRIIFNTRVNTHEVEQLRAHADGVDQNTVQVEAENAAQHLGDLRELSMAQIRIQGAVDSSAKRNGWSDEEKQAHRSAALSIFHGAVLEAALDAGKLDYARAYLDLHGKELDPALASKAREALEDEARFQKVGASVDKVYAEGGTFAEKSQKLRDIFKNDEKGQREAIQELHERKRQQDVAHDEMVGLLWDMKTGLNGQKPLGIRDIMKSREWASLDGEERKKLSRDFEADDRRGEGRESPEEQVAKFATYLKITENPHKLMSMSDGQIVALTGTLGRELTKDLLEAKRGVKGSLAKLQDVTLTNEFNFSSIAKEYGLTVSGVKDPDKVQKIEAQLGELKARVVANIAADQVSTGRTLTGDQKEAIARKWLKKVPTRDKDVFLWFDSTGNKPLFQVGSFSELDATDEEKTLALDYLVKAGAPTTAENVWTMIQAMRKKKSGG